MNRNHSLETAATLAYYGFFALIPLLLLLVFAASRLVVASRAAIEAIEGLGRQVFPEFGELLVRELRTLSQQRAWTAISVLLLFWSLTPLAATVRAAFNRTFAPPRPMPLWLAKLRDVAGALTLLGLVTLVVAGKIAYGTVAHRLPRGVPLALEALHFGGSFALATLGLAVFYAVFVPVRLSWRELLGGAGLAAVLLFLLRAAFGAFLRFNPNYGYTFGSLKAIFLVFMWVYLFFLALLLAAEVTANVRRRDAAFLRRLLEGEAQTGLRRGQAALAGKFERLCAPGERIFAEGEKGRTMYLVVAGEVVLRRNGQPVHTVGPGGFFGELSLLLDTPRTAEAIAGADGAHLVEIVRENFETILQEHPQVAVRLLKELAERIKTTDERFVTTPSAAPPPGPSVPT